MVFLNNVVDQRGLAINQIHPAPGAIASGRSGVAINFVVSQRNCSRNDVNAASGVFADGGVELLRQEGQ